MPRTAAEKPKNETTYIVLVQHENGPTLSVVGDVLANGPEQAVRRLPDLRPELVGPVGTFVAVPARNWTIVEQQEKPQPPVVEQTVKKWGEGNLETLTGDAAPREEIVPDSRRAPTEAEALDAEIAAVGDLQTRRTQEGDL